MELSDFEAIADYWERQAELYPDNLEGLSMRTIAVADYMIEQALRSGQHPETRHE